MFSDPNSEVRRGAAVALLDYPGAESLRWLDAFFRAEIDDEARRTVCAGLGADAVYGRVPGVAALLARLLAEDPAPEVRRAAAEGLAGRGGLEAGDALRRAEKKDSDQSVRTAAAAARRRTPRPAAPAEQPAPDDPERLSLTELLSILRDAPPAIARRESAGVLRQGAYRDPRTFQALADAMSFDLDHGVRQAAAMALLDYPGEGTTLWLARFFQGEGSEEVRRAVCGALATALAHRGDLAATDLLTALLAEDRSAAVRTAAAWGLARRQDLRTLGALKQAADKDPDSVVSAAAAAAYRLILSRKLPGPEPPPAPLVRARLPKGTPEDYGWCECLRLPLKIKPKWRSLQDCEHTYYNSYQHAGFMCSWGGQKIKPAVQDESH
jgi:HEAT repeat protein